MMPPAKMEGTPFPKVLPSTLDKSHKDEVLLSAAVLSV
jgi:hypothetical protein